MEVDVVALASEFPNDNPALHGGTIWVCLEPTGLPVAERAAAERAPVAAKVVETIAAREERTLEVALLASAILEPDVDEADEPIVIEELEPSDTWAWAEGDADVMSSALRSDLDAPPAAPARVSEIVLAGTHALEEDEALSPESSDGRSFFEASVDESAPETSSSYPAALPPRSDDPFTTFIFKLVDVAVATGSLEVAAVLPDLLGSGRISAGVGVEVAGALRANGLWDGGDVAPSFIRVAHAWRDILRGTSEDFDACGGASLDEWASDVLAKLLGAPARLPLLRQELRSRGVAAFGLVEAA